MESNKSQNTICPVNMRGCKFSQFNWTCLTYRTRPKRHPWRLQGSQFRRVHIFGSPDNVHNVHIFWFLCVPGVFGEKNAWPWTDFLASWMISLGSWTDQSSLQNVGSTVFLFQRQWLTGIRETSFLESNDWFKGKKPETMFFITQKKRGFYRQFSHPTLGWKVYSALIWVLCSIWTSQCLSCPSNAVNLRRWTSLRFFTDALIFHVVVLSWMICRKLLFYHVKNGIRVFFPLKMSLDANSSEMSASKGFLQREMCGKWAVVPVQFVFLYWDLMGILWGIHVCISNYNHLGVSENGGFSPKLCQLMRKCWLTNWITSNTHRKESDVCNGM